jgi:hypothetical protein
MAKMHNPDSERFGLPTGESIEHLAVMELSATDFEAQRPAIGVYSRVNLTRPTSA